MIPFTRKFKTIILFVFAIAIQTWFVGAQSAPITSDIKSQRGEKWWGAIVDFPSYRSPFNETFEIDTQVTSPLNFTADILLSSKGRYIWCGEPMSITFNGNSFHIITHKVKPEIERGGRTLRDAYLVCCHRNFPPDGSKLSEMLYRAPIYELGGEESLLYTQNDVLNFADFLLYQKVPKGSILIPVGWQSQSGDALFDPENFPEPRLMVDSLHAKGFKVMLTITPYVMASGRGFLKNRVAGRLLFDRNNEPVIFRSRMGYTACMNFHNEEAEELNRGLKKLMSECGIDGFYFDCLDAVPLLEDDLSSLLSFYKSWTSASEGITSVIYSTPSNMQLSQTVSTASPTRRTTWNILRSTMTATINASVMGFTRTSIAADLDFAPNNDRLILRTAQLSAMLPVMIVPYASWTIADITPLKQMLSWRGAQSDYLASVVESSYSTAEPVVRHLEYEFPSNGFSNCNDQFMIGDLLLVAPVVGPSDKRMVRLPKGLWVDMSGKRIKGPKVINANLSDGTMAVYKLAK